MSKLFDKVHQQVLQECQNYDWDSGPGNTWIPPGGYKGAAILTKIKEREGVFQDGTEYCAFDFTFQLLDGEHAGRNVRHGIMFTNPAKQGTEYSVIEMCRFASCVSGAEVRDIAKAREILLQTSGPVIKLGITPNEKSPKHPRFYYNGLVETVAPAPATA